MISTTTAMGFGVVLAGVVAGWNQVKAYLLQLYSFFMHRVEIDYQMTRFVRIYLHKQCRWQTSNTKVFWVQTQCVLGEKNALLALYKTHASANSIYWVKGGFVILSGSGGTCKSTLICPRTVNVDQLLSAAISMANDELRDSVTSTFYVIRKTGSRFKQEQVSKSGSAGSNEVNRSTEITDIYDPRYSWLLNFAEDRLGYTTIPLIDSLYLTVDMLAALEDARRWYKSRTWYENHGIRWKRGWLLYGKPGCGKTRMVEAIAQDLKIPLRIYDLASMTNEDFNDALAVCTDPHILLIEDFDTVFNGRVNTTTTDMSPGVTFDCFLNGIDGIQSHYGMLVVITTNCIANLDPAIAGCVGNEGGSTRPGRVDRIFQLGDLPPEGLAWMAHKILGDFPAETWQDLLLLEGQTGAQFQELCCRRAMDLYWAKHT